MIPVHFIPPSQRRIAMHAVQAEGAPVLLLGAEGTGKSAIARWIHQNGARAAKAFVQMSPARSGLPLLEQITAARGGTFLIPELAELSENDLQDLIGFLKTRTARVPGHPELPMLVHVRLMAATSGSVSLALAGLFERLGAFVIQMPPLVARKEEFEDIALGILHEITHELHREYLKTIAPAAWARLAAYDWPGNLRELRNVLRVAAIAAPGAILQEEDLPEFGHGRLEFRAPREEFERLSRPAPPQTS